MKTQNKHQINPDAQSCQMAVCASVLVDASLHAPIIPAGIYKHLL